MPSPPPGIVWAACQGCGSQDEVMRQILWKKRRQTIWKLNIHISPRLTFVLHNLRSDRLSFIPVLFLSCCK